MMTWNPDFLSIQGIRSWVSLARPIAKIRFNLQMKSNIEAKCGENMIIAFDFCVFYALMLAWNCDNFICFINIQIMYIQKVTKTTTKRDKISTHNTNKITKSNILSKEPFFVLKNAL